jgi:uncharacterized FAD-dependent dehydrogenase
MTDATFDVAVVGAGPAGLFVTRRLLDRNRKLTVALIDKGAPAHLRNTRTPLRTHNGWESHDIVSGVGGAGLFSDGKLILTLNAGGKITDDLPERAKTEYLAYVERCLLKFGTHSKRSSDAADRGFLDAVRHEGLEYKHLPVRHFGTKGLARVLTGLLSELLRVRGTELLSERLLVQVEPDSVGFRLALRKPDGTLESLTAKRVVFAVGKEGSIWLSQKLAGLGVASSENRLYFGLRLESKHDSRLSKFSFDPKLSFEFDDGTRIKTHCFCEEGHILPLRYFGLPLAGSHTPRVPSDPRRKPPDNTVLGVLLGAPDDPGPLRDQIFALMAQAERMGRGRLLVQRLGDFKRNRPSDLSRIATGAVKPSTNQSLTANLRDMGFPLNFDQKFLSFIERIGRLAPSVADDDTLLYAPAVEWWMPRIATNRTMETACPGLYVAGDGAGVSQGIMYAAVTGVLVADGILANMAGAHGSDRLADAA